MAHFIWWTKTNDRVFLLTSQKWLMVHSNLACYEQFYNWTKRLIFLVCDFELSCTKPTTLYCDNQNTLHITIYLMFHEDIKYLDNKSDVSWRHKVSGYWLIHCQVTVTI